jgi:hypothetical protein
MRSGCKGTRSSIGQSFPFLDFNLGHPSQEGKRRVGASQRNYRRLMMKKFSIAMIALAVAVAFTPAAFADGYSFTFADSGANNPSSILPGVSGSGWFDVTGGVITAFGGNFFLTPTSTAQAMTIDAPGTGFDNDNTFNASGSPSYFDLGGFVFTAGGVEYNFFSWGTGDNITTNTSGGTYTPITLDITETPEPGTLLLLGTGILGMALLVFRNAKPASRLIQQA